MASNHEDATYEIFFRLYKDPTKMSVYYFDFMIPITVTKGQAPAIDVQVINDLDQHLFVSKDYSFPSFIDIIGMSTSFNALTINQTK